MFVAFLVSVTEVEGGALSKLAVISAIGLWSAVLVEQLQGTQVALLSRMHHLLVVDETALFL